MTHLLELDLSCHNKVLPKSNPLLLLEKPHLGFELVINLQVKTTTVFINFW